MSEQSIYNALRSGGLSAAGACGMMGNMWAESVMKPNNVQDHSPIGDSDYTYMVDNGIISRAEFCNGKYGYGLCQWTHPSRQAGLYDYAKSLNVSISNEQMQCDYCLMELHTAEFANVYDFLCTTNDVAEAAKIVCADFEKPAVNNFAVRINAAQRFYNQFADGEVYTEPPTIPDTQLLLSVDVRVLKKGDKGRDVFLLQCGLVDMGYDCGLPDGDFGRKTEEAVKQLQRSNGLSCSGVADLPTWNIILKPR